MRTPLKVYVACALTSVPKSSRPEHLMMVESLKAELRSKGYLVIDFLSAIKDNPVPEDVYSYDIKCLDEADCILALCDYPGTGLGYEICYSVLLRKIPTFVAVSDETNLSKLLRGINLPNYKYVVFSKTSDLLEKFDKFVRN